MHFLLGFVINWVPFLTDDMIYDVNMNGGTFLPKAIQRNSELQNVPGMSQNSLKQRYLSGKQRS